MNRLEYVVLVGIALLSVAVGAFSTGLPLAEFLARNGEEAARLTLVMWWETWWALVVGFVIAGAVEAWVSKERIADYLEGYGPREIGLGSFFGFVSSSCSFSAVATAKNLFKKGSSAAASLGAFMFAATNLVIEIGLVMWVLLGWQFVLADFVGGMVLIVLMAVALTFVVPGDLVEEARRHAVEREGVEETDPVCGMDVDAETCDVTVEHGGKTYYFCSEGCRESFDPEEVEDRSILDHATSRRGWRMLADKQWKEWVMLWEDIAVGFVLAGVIGAFVPTEVWTSLFGAEFLGLPVFVLYTAALGAVIGVVTFVCSVGNVPFAAILWNNGLPFGSVLSYIYADLIVPPIVDAYRKYYGARFAAALSLSIFVSAVVTGVVIHFLFLSTGLIPTGTAEVVERSIELNYKAYLNVAAGIVFLALYNLRRKG